MDEILPSYSLDISQKEVKRKRCLSDGDIRTEENKTALTEPRYNSHGAPRDPTANKDVSAFSAPPAFAYFGPVTKMNEDWDEEDDDESEEEEFLPPKAEKPTIPNYEGFKKHIQRLYPDMKSQCNWLVARLAHQQEVRYKNLLDTRIKHSEAVNRKYCASGRQCLALGGSTTDWKDKPLGQSLSGYNSDSSNPREDAINEETFPINVPMPPTRNLPAEFECQLCFRVKKFQKPSDWTNHVHEDVQPFTCTYEKCREPKSFKRKADWVRHENERHKHLEWWICQVDDCRHSSYRKNDFLQHLVRDHKFAEPMQKTKAAIKKARLIEPTWLVVEQCHHGTLSKPEDEPCKFCGKTCRTWKKLTVHLAKHMEHIALSIIQLVETSNMNADPTTEETRDLSSAFLHTFKTDTINALREKRLQRSAHRKSMFTNTGAPDPARREVDLSSLQNYVGSAVPSILDTPTFPSRPGDIVDQMDIDSVLIPRNDNESTETIQRPRSSEPSLHNQIKSTALTDPLGHQSCSSGASPVMDDVPRPSSWLCCNVGCKTNILHFITTTLVTTTCPNCGHDRCYVCEDIYPQSILRKDYLKSPIKTGGPPVAALEHYGSTLDTPILPEPPYSVESPIEKWSPEEDALLVNLRKGGMSWEDISKRLLGRSAISCRLHHQDCLIEKADEIEQWSRTCSNCQADSIGETCHGCGRQRTSSLHTTLPSIPGSDSRQESTKFKEQQLSHDWDVQSLASLNTFNDSGLGSSLPSNISGSQTQGLPKTAQEEILLILFSDQQFKSLLESAASLISKPRFTRNVRRLLIPFQQELHNAAADHREKDAKRIIERHSPWLASRLFDMSDPENKSNAHNMAAHLNQHIDKRPMLESYLASTIISTVPSSIPATDGSKQAKVTLPSGDSTTQNTPEEAKNIHSPESSDASDADGSEMDIENYIDYSQFPNLEHIKNFIIGGTPFANLKRSTFQFLNPGKPTIASPKRSPEMPSEDSFENTGSTATTEVTIPDVELEEDSDDAASIASDDPALAGAAESRILNPREYFEKLENLERMVFEDSGFLFTEVNAKAGESQHTRPLLSFEESRHFPRMISKLDMINAVKLSRSRSLLHLLECYSIVWCTSGSLTRLKIAGYLDDAITLLTMERDICRHRVAKMVQISVQKIDHLMLIFWNTLRIVVSELETLEGGQHDPDIVDSIVQKQAQYFELTALCEEILDAMNITPPRPRGKTNPLPEACPISWDCAVQTLQLAVLSYAGAHIQRFDLDLIGSDVIDFQLPVRLHYQDEVLQEISSRSIDVSIRLRRRKFQCLDKLLRGCQPWVFHDHTSSMGEETLHLSTSIGALTDVWGPSWKILDERGNIPRYDIGNGSIIPWYEAPENHSIHSSTTESEIYCHWISSKDWNEELVSSNQSRLPRKYFLESDTLLIGANTEFGLNVNPECSSSPERLSRLKTQLHDQGALKYPRTFRDKRYIDSHAVQVTGTAFGIISGSGTVTYKRRVGHTMKDALVERWRHNRRSPLDLEAFSGVEVSFCTKNARRRRLMHLLSSNTMRNYLSTISFSWISEACEHAYFKALRCPKTFRRFWKDHKEWQESVGDAVSICLDALEETGIDEDSGELSALWVESFDEQGESDGESDGEEDKEDAADSPPSALTPLEKPDSGFCEEHIVTLFRSEHTWTGFLHDSEESLTMAIVGMTCLDFQHENGYGRRCAGQRALGAQSTSTSTPKGFAVLQTSLKLNESLLKSEKLKQEKVDSGRKTIWDAKELKRGTAFALGNHGTLKVLTAATRTCPTVAEWSGVKSEILKEVKNVAVNEKMLGRPAERHHCEYIRGSWEASPLPVLVMSKSTKVIFAKC